MRHDVARIELDVDLVFGFADFDAASNPRHGNRVAAGVQRDVAFDIDDAFMKPVDFRNPGRERFQMQALDGEQLARNGADVFFVSAVDAITPLGGLGDSSPPNWRTFVRRGSCCR